MLIVNGFRVKRDITGQKFYRMLAIKPVQVARRNRSVGWEFLCDCGNVVVRVPDDLKRGHTKSCGCLQKENARSLKIKPKGISAFNYKYSAYEVAAKSRDLEFNLTKEEFREITQQKCYYCNVEPYQISNPANRNGVYVYNGIDRLDNSKGYIENNCVPCCGRCNAAKRDLSVDDFLLLIEKIYYHRVSLSKE